MRTHPTARYMPVSIAMLVLIATGAFARPGWPDCDVCLLPLATGNTWQFASDGRPTRSVSVRTSKSGAHYVDGLLNEGAWLSNSSGLSYDDIYVRNMAKATAYPMFLVDARVGARWSVKMPSTGVRYEVAYAADQLTLTLPSGKKLFDVRRYTLCPTQSPARGSDIMAIDFAPGLGPVRLLTLDGRTHLLTQALLSGKRVL